MKKFLALFCVAALIFCAIPVMAEEEVEADGEQAVEEVTEEAIPTVEGSIFIAPLRPENAQALMDLFEVIDGEEGQTSFDLAMLLAGEENELSEEDIDALSEELEGFDEALSNGYLTDVGDAIIDAEALGLEDGEVVKGIVLEEGIPAIVEAEVEDGIFTFEVTEPSVCFLFSILDEDAEEEEAIPTVEGSIFIAPLRPENAQALMDLFEVIDGEEGQTSFDLAMLLAGEENELSEEDIDALSEELEGFNEPLSNGYLTDVGDAIIDAEALELEDGDVVKAIVLEEGIPAIVEAEVEDGIFTFEVIEPSVCFLFAE